jgi:hypothetical protein
MPCKYAYGYAAYSSPVAFRMNCSSRTVGAGPFLSSLSSSTYTRKSCGSGETQGTRFGQLGMMWSRCLCAVMQAIPAMHGRLDGVHGCVGRGFAVAQQPLTLHAHCQGHAVRQPCRLTVWKATAGRATSP